MERTEPLRVLVVEDNPHDQELLQWELRKTSMRNSMLFLDDPRKALDLIRGPGSREIRENLIALFLDVHLPHMSGIELLRTIRSLDGLERLPVIVMTSSPRPEVIAACDELGVAALVEKPVTLNQFSKVIASLFHNSSVSPVISSL